VVKLVRLPAGQGGAKVGLDDYLVGHGPDAFRGLLAAATDPKPPGPGPAAETAGVKAGIEDLPLPPALPELPEQALYGLAGDIVRTIEPHTEADPAGILGQLLAAVGNAIGRGRNGQGPYFQVEGDRHYASLYVNAVGATGHGRKGTSLGRVRQPMKHADEGWLKGCIRSGLASGEGIIYFVRNPLGNDEGIPDKRLLVVETEFARVLRVMCREGNTLSTTIRQGWDTGNLSTLTRNNPLTATHAHVSIIGHITLAELLKYLGETEVFNGFANRFLWLLVRRRRLLPDGGGQLDLSAHGEKLAAALEKARGFTAMSRSADAGRLWRQVYPLLTAERAGLYGACTGRAEAQVLRLSMVYALLDGSKVVRAPHLRAALGLWSYADASARRIFGGEPPDPLADTVLEKLRAAAATGLTRSALHQSFSNNVKAAALVAALAKLQDRGDAYFVKQKTGQRGATPERWFARPSDELNEKNESIRAATDADGFVSYSSFLSSSGPETDDEAGRAFGQDLKTPWDDQGAD
jgi:hypothetical protein